MTDEPVTEVPGTRGRPGLKELLRRRRGCIGGLIRLANESVVELMGRIGFDFVVLDCEHGPADQLALHRHVVAADAGGMATVVRVAGIQPEEIQRALDLGVDGILVPHVSGPAQARQVVAAAHYPPLGRRGVSRFTRAGDYGLVDADTHLRSAAARTTVLVMVEDRAGCDAAAEILAVDGVDGVMVGPADLALSGAHEGAALSPVQVEQLADEVYAKAARAGLATMEIVSSAAEATAAAGRGRELVLFNVQALLTSALVDAASALLRTRPDRTDR